jgi:hypothetical protein
MAKETIKKKQKEKIQKNDDVSLKEIKAFNPMSLAKIMTVIYLVIGFIVGIILSLVSLFGIIYNFGDSSENALGLFGIVYMPIGYAVMGFLGGLLFAWLYNKFAKKVGGIKLELK